MNNLKIVKDSSLITICSNLDKEIFEEYFSEKMIEDDDLRELYCLIKEDKYIGYIYLHGDEIEKEIYRIGILKEYQNQGYGSYFLNEVINKLNTDRILLEVRVNNLPAISLYKKCGFVEFFVRKNYYSDGTDALLMELKVR